ncbi:P-type conjugative transfer protein VirB9 [Microvirga puerhi]|uniref:P-type conjugative transfer protein VirB9 n=1 Tax=Microvirga puerhi TaxID=2876078 RepID=A0ABS7VTE4_9HYPH|nr:P-type conjugative transfer protein VirB9 [Microvirga puerhi]MBZ6078843.1 P-type conjugative transfer protein VirB9 [Microvirga puerhi]
MKRLALALCLVAASGGADALQTPNGGSRDDRVRTVFYDPANVVKIIGVSRAATQIQFAEDEEVAFAAVGDSVAWEVVNAGSMLFIKPRESHPPTNMQVVTTRRDGSKRSYIFELMSRDGGISNGSESYFLVKFQYPDDEAARARAEAAARQAAAEAREADNALLLHQSYGPRNFSYSAQGSAPFEPVSVYDDGKTTAFTFPGNIDLPAIYMENSDGSESLVPKDTRGDLVVVHAISRKFILRRGEQAMCVFNEAYDPAGINPGTGTTSPSVQRTIKLQATR